MDDEAPRARKGSRRATRRERPRRLTGPRVLALIGAAMAATVAWAVLVYAGIAFGRSARDGEGSAWVFTAIASLGAVACLFLALMLGSRAVRARGAISPGTDGPEGLVTNRARGGKRRR